VAPIWLGILGLVTCMIFWMVTNRVEPLFVTSFGGLLAVGAGARALDTLRQPPAPPIPPGDPPATPPDAGGPPS
jgi:hypothetical protein